MESFEPKKLALIRVFQLLQKYSDKDHIVKYDELVTLLKKEYGIVIERKAIGRNISLLKEAGLEIETTPKGVYLSERTFEDSELRLLIDGVLASKHITPNHSVDLINKLCGLSNKYFRKHVKNVYSVNDWNKTDNAAVFYNIDMIDEAIESAKQIKFDYNKYGADKKMHKSATHIFSVYQMVLNNQRYYLMGYNEKWQHIQFLRIDRITNIVLLEDMQTPIRSISGYNGGIDYKQLSSSLPYMYSDTPQTVEFLTDDSTIDQVVDWFGKDITIIQKDSKYLVRVVVSLKAMVYWAMQYLNAVEIMSPIELRQQIAQNVKAAVIKYSQC